MAARGRRARRGPLVVHLILPDEQLRPSGAGARGGVVVGRRVGSAVTRNLVKRRLRELLRAELADLPAGSLVVVRALPSAAEASFARLRSALAGAMRAVVAAPAPPAPEREAL